jgi:hypothetical protein
MTSKTLSGLTALVLGVAGAAFGAVGLGTAAAQEEAGPRLSGTFSMIGRVTEQSGALEGSTATGRFDYRFAPRCRRGACDVRRFTAGVPSLLLEREGRRVYRGVQTRSVSCGDGATRLRIATTVRVVESRGGIARRIVGGNEFTLSGGCTGEATTVFRGNRRAARSPRFTG